MAPSKVNGLFINLFFLTRFVPYVNICTRNARNFIRINWAQHLGKHGGLQLAEIAGWFFFFADCASDAAYLYSADLILRYKQTESLTIFVCLRYSAVCRFIQNRWHFPRTLSQISRINHSFWSATVSPNKQFIGLLLRDCQITAV